MNNKVYDIVVVGGGHAGVEAAWIASQFECLRVGIITKADVPIAGAPCNPAVGGVGKGQLVRELDALGGIMPMLADLSAIQCRRLNESKGYAVQSTRFQIDKDFYPAEAERIIKNVSNIDLIRADLLEVVETSHCNKGIFLLRTNGPDIEAKKIVFTVGTFLDGRIHRGGESFAGGRDGIASSADMNTIFSRVPVLPKLFKTGTPPRIKYSTIDISEMEEQPSDGSVENFHVLHGTNRFLNQVSCHKTNTSSDTIDLILKNKERSPMFNGQIKGVGPRYCPSIEDKAFRYPDRSEHHVFVEPETLELETVYPNGISTSLPRSVQDEMIKSIKGFEHAEIERYGYAVEYQVVDTSFMDLTLEHQLVPGVYFAGQVNGTSGYEEAAGQGYVAGINAAMAILNREKVVFPRGTSYLGVLIDDVVGVRRDEPYRLFTARAENRLFLREDNAMDRLGGIRLSFGLTKGIDRYLNEYNYQKEVLLSVINSVGNVFENQKSIKDKLRDSEIDPVFFLKSFLESKKILIDFRVIKAVAIAVKYEGYLKKSMQKNISISNLSSRAIDWSTLSENKSISNECRQRIKLEKPKTFFQLKSIQGIRPATLSYVASGVL